MSGGIARSLVAVFVVAVVVAIFATGGNGGSDPPLVIPVGASQVKIERAHALLERRLTARRREIASYRRLVWSCEEDLDAPRSRASSSVWSLRRDVAYRARIRDLWKGRFAGCEMVRARRTLPNTNDWVTAVRIAQRPYPGTAARALAISRHEGGSGAWVWWGGRPWTGRHIGDDPWGDDTVGGWEQFRYSTFIVYWPDVLADLKRRGFIVPYLGWARPSVVAGASTGYGPWLSPLGQALTVAYMHFYGRQGCHWCGVPG